jgi:hypothetical protein
MPSLVVGLWRQRRNPWERLNVVGDRPEVL